MLKIEGVSKRFRAGNYGVRGVACVARCSPQTAANCGLTARAPQTKSDPRAGYRFK